MSDEKKVQNEKEVKSDGKLEKQVANIAFTVRKIKDKLEEQLGMDIDGDGRIGSGSYKKALIFLLVAGMASIGFAENKTALAYWASGTYIDSSGNMVAPYFYGEIAATNLPTTVATNVTVALTRQALGSVSNATATSALTMQRPGAQTPTITVTPLAPSTVTPTITVTPETGAVTASGANDLVTPIATITPQTVTFLNVTNVTYQTETITYLSDLVTTNTTTVVTNVIVWTQSQSPATNATCAITPDLASNAVVVVTVTGGGAVMTNATAASSALPDFITNATAVSSALLDYPTNATATVTVSVEREAVAALTNAVLTIQRVP